MVKLENLWKETSLSFFIGGKYMLHENIINLFKNEQYEELSKLVSSIDINELLFFTLSFIFSYSFSKLFSLKRIKVVF